MNFWFRTLETVVLRFLARYPDMALHYVAEGGLVDIVEQGFDAGVQLGEAVPQDMAAVLMGGDTRFLGVASPAYLAGWLPPVVPDDLRHHCCIRHRLPSGKRYRWECEKHGQEVAIDVPGGPMLDQNGLMAEAAVAGLGIAYVSERAVRTWLEDRRLVAVLNDWCPRIPGLCLDYPGHRHVFAGLRACIEVVKDARL